MPTRSIPWPRIVAEGIAIVVSILLAFGIQAWWDDAQLARAENQLLQDLADEFRRNRQNLSLILEAQTVRREHLGILIREAGPNKVGIASDSLQILADVAALNPRLIPSTDVLDGGDLEIISDADLRRRISGFWPRYQSYYGNQGRYVDLRLSPEVLLGTGTGLMEFERIRFSEDTEFWSDPLTPEQTNLLKFFAVAEFLSGLGDEQGRELGAALDSLITEIERATKR